MKKLPLPFCSCCSSCPFAAFVDKKKLPLRSAVAFVPLPLPFCSCRSPRPFAGGECDADSPAFLGPVCAYDLSATLRGRKKKLTLSTEEAVAVLSARPIQLRGQRGAKTSKLDVAVRSDHLRSARQPLWRMCATKRSCRCRCRSAARSREPLRGACRARCSGMCFVPFVALCGQKEVAVCRSAVAVLRDPSRTQKEVAVAVLQLLFFVPLRGLFRGQKEVPVAVLQLPFFVPLRALRGQKEVAVAVLQLPFSAPLRYGSKRCSPRPSADRPQLSTQTGYALVATHKN